VDDDALQAAAAADEAEAEAEAEAMVLVEEEQEEAVLVMIAGTNAHVADFTPLGIAGGKADDVELAAVAATVLAGCSDEVSAKPMVLVGADAMICRAMTSREGCDKSMCPMACNS
jgi:hypothetical protein